METFYKIQDFVSGYKTYIVSILLATYSLCVAFNWIQWSIEQEVAVFGLLGALLGTTIRAGINKV